MSLASVRRPSVRKHFRVCLLTEYRLEYFNDTSQLCRTGHDDVSRTKMRALVLKLFELSPYDVFMHILVRSVT